jgi:hypothetical protein
MQLKLKLAAIASAIALAVSLGVTFAGPAAATDDVRLCVNDTKGQQGCAEDYPTSGVIVNLVTNIDNSSPWDIPGTSGQISYPGNNLCMELDKTDGNIIKLEPCQGKASEEWTTSKGSEKGTTIFTNKYETDQCLNADPYGDYPAVIGSKCNGGTNQEWFSPEP